MSSRNSGLSTKHITQSLSLFLAPPQLPSEEGFPHHSALRGRPRVPPTTRALSSLRARRRGAQGRRPAYPRS